jgi:hypothetical protein
MDRRDFLATVAALPFLPGVEAQSLRPCNRRLIVDHDDNWSWDSLGGGWPACIRADELHLSKADWQILLGHALGDEQLNCNCFDGDILRAEITMKLADWMDAADLDPDPWPGMVFGWKEVADWLRQGECRFVLFPKRPQP